MKVIIMFLIFFSFAAQAQTSNQPNQTLSPAAQTFDFQAPGSTGTTFANPTLNPNDINTAPTNVPSDTSLVVPQQQQQDPFQNQTQPQTLPQTQPDLNTSPLPGPTSGPTFQTPTTPSQQFTP